MPFVKIFTRAYIGKGPCRAPLVIWIKRFMLTLCKQGVVGHEIAKKRERCITSAGCPAVCRLCRVVCQCVKTPKRPVRTTR
jgi:hypothetical protein